MIQQAIYTTKGRFLRYEMAEPECGKDFCENCGDCLVCYWDEGLCYDGSPHSWRVEVDEE
jgi:hypothetical protein